MSISPNSMPFTLLLGLLVALPSLAIDTSLPTLGAVAATLHATPAAAGLTISSFMVGFAIAPLLYGPISDRYGRKPVALFACLLFTAAAIGCSQSNSLAGLIAWRVVQGAGGGAGLSVAMAIVRDLFEGSAARERMSHVTMTTMVVPMLAPTLGISLLPLGGWRAIHGFLACVGILLSLLLLGLRETVPRRPAQRLLPSSVAREYAQVLSCSSSCRYLLMAAGMFGALFAYVSGSPLFFLGAAGLSPTRYGLVFAATSLGIMAGAFLSGRLNAKGIGCRRLFIAGLGSASAATGLLLAMGLAGWMPLAVVVALLVCSNVAFGVVMPNAVERAMQPFAAMAGVAGSVMSCVQMATGAAVSGAVAALYDGRTALSMIAVMAGCVLLASASYLFGHRARGDEP